MKNSKTFIQAASVVAVAFVIFYLVGIITNFFGSPIFRSFWIISRPTAYDIAFYTAVGLEVTLCSIVSPKAFFKKETSETSPKGNLKIKSSSETQKAWVAAFIVLCGLSFCTIGEATNLFGSSLFPELGITVETSHEIVVYLAIAVAAMLEAAIATQAAYGKIGADQSSKFKSSYNLRKAWLIGLFAVFCLFLFYSIGVISDFFASPMFSAFWMVNIQTAYDIVTYTGAALTVVVAVTAVAWSFPKEHKISFSFKPIGLKARITQASHKAKQQVVTPFVSTGKSESDELDLEPEIHLPPKNNLQLNTQPPFQPQPTILPPERVFSTEGVFNIQGTGRMACLTCKKEFDDPLFKLDCGNHLPRLILSCPYCNRSSCFEWKNVAEAEDLDPWRSHFKAYP